MYFHRTVRDRAATVWRRCSVAVGLHPSGETLTAVRDAPAPTILAELRSYFGLVNHYGWFIPRLATISQLADDFSRLYSTGPNSQRHI